jgi:hypothetical protein
MDNGNFLRMSSTKANSDAMRTGKRFSLCSVASAVIVAGFVVVSCAAYGIQPAIPKIEDSAGWQLSEGCRVYKFGILTAPDCDILTGKGIAIQITRIRLLSLQPGQDNRSTIGIEFHSDHSGWSFSSPSVALLIAGRSYTPSDIDEAIVFAKQDRPIFPEPLQPNLQRYDLPPGEKRFFRLRFAVPQNELRNGFVLRVTGLQREGEAVRVPILEFEFK